MSTISVIVPVYKVETYLPTCVDSILAQTFRDFELILVDDGSPDGCGVLCDAYAAKDPRIRVIHQKNGGLSAARNAGIKLAKGEYLTFIDSDDVVSAVYLETLLRLLQSKHASVSAVPLLEFEQEAELPIERKDKNLIGSGAMTGRDAALSIYRGSGEVGVCACGKLFQRKQFANCLFPVGKLHEDQFTIPIILYSANIVAFCITPLYFYRRRSESIMHDTFTSRKCDNLEAIENCIRFYQEHEDRELVKAASQTKKKVNALIVISALSAKRQDELPKQYRMGKWKAIYRCYKYAPDDTYTWYLAKLYPSGPRYHAYIKRIRQIIKKAFSRKPRE